MPVRPRKINDNQNEAERPKAIVAKPYSATDHKIKLPGRLIRVTMMLIVLPDNNAPTAGAASRKPKPCAPTFKIFAAKIGSS